MPTRIGMPCSLRIRHWSRVCIVPQYIHVYFSTVHTRDHTCVLFHVWFRELLCTEECTEQNYQLQVGGK